MRPVFEPLGLEKDQRIFNYLIVEKPHFNSYWHYHSELEISFVESGRGIRSIGDHVQAFKEGDLILIGKELPHSRESIGQDKRFKAKAHIFHFSSSNLYTFREFRFLRSFLEEAIYGFHFFDPKPEVVDLIKNFSDLPATKQLLSFFEILIHLYEDQNRSTLASVRFKFLLKDANKGKRINEITDYINQNLHKDLKIEDLARKVFVSKSYFCRWFKQNTGNTFIEYINKIRVEYVCQQLTNNISNESIAQIAFRSGFQNTSHFNRVFKNMKGVSPRELVKSSVKAD